MTEQKLEELLPCPFHKLDTSVDLTDNDYGRWFVACGGCGASSGHCKTKERAVYSWNNDRASTTREAELKAEVERLRDFIGTVSNLGPYPNKKLEHANQILADLRIGAKHALNQESKP